MLCMCMVSFALKVVQPVVRNEKLTVMVSAQCQGGGLYVWANRHKLEMFFVQTK